MNNSEEVEHNYIRLLKPSFALKTFVWFVSLLLSFTLALIFDASTVLIIGFIVLNLLSFGLVSIISDVVASIAEKKRKQPNKRVVCC